MSRPLAIPRWMHLILPHTKAPVEVTDTEMILMTRPEEALPKLENENLDRSKSEKCDSAEFKFQTHVEWTSVAPLAYWTLFLRGRLKCVASNESVTTGPVSAAASNTVFGFPRPVSQLCVNFCHGIGALDNYQKDLPPICYGILKWVNQHKTFGHYEWEISTCNGNGICSPFSCSHIHPTKFRVTVELFDVPVPLLRTIEIVLPRDHSVGTIEFLQAVDHEMGPSWLYYVIKNIEVINSQFE
jgi:hypothetical protein